MTPAQWALLKRCRDALKDYSRIQKLRGKEAESRNIWKLAREVTEELDKEAANVR